MSATGRGARRRDADYYPTPAWCVAAILDRLRTPPGRRWLEPCAGDGAIVRAVNAWVARVGLAERLWHMVELRADAAHRLEDLGGVTIGDFLTAEVERADVAILNPPFVLALDFVRRCLEVASVTIYLERLNWLASQERSHWLREHTPDVYVLPRRPSFVGGTTDACDYAWLVWPTPSVRTAGTVEILNLHASQMEMVA